MLLAVIIKHLGLGQLVLKTLQGGETFLFIARAKRQLDHSGFFRRRRSETVRIFRNDRDRAAKDEVKVDAFETGTKSVVQRTVRAVFE